MKKRLIVVDMQNDFITGPLGTPEARAIVPNVKKKIEEYKARGDEVVFTKDMHFKDYLNTHEGRYLPIEHCMALTDGSKIIKELRGEDFDDFSVYVKSKFGCINVIDYRCNQYELIGVCTDICLISTALILRTAHCSADIVVDASCCAGTTPEKHKAALEVMKSCHIDILE